MEIDALESLIMRSGLTRRADEVRPYSQPITDQDLDEFQRLVGAQVPAEVRYFLTRHGGFRGAWTMFRTPVGTKGGQVVWSNIGRHVSSVADADGLRDRSHLIDCFKQIDYPEAGLLRPVEELIEDYVMRLLPLSLRGVGEPVLCLDFRYDADRPPVVRVQWSELGAPDLREWGEFVAVDFVDFLNQCGVYGDDEEPWADEPITPYPHATAFSEWSDWFYDYLAQWQPPKRMR